MYINKLKEMFDKMTVCKDPSVISYYHHPDFVLYTNDLTMTYDAYVQSLQDIYKTPIEFEVGYDEETLLEQGERVAGRVWITTTMPGEAPKKIEVMLIAQYKDGKIFRIWELTYPDWSKMDAFL